MQRAESPDQVAGINGHDLARGEQLRQRVERNAIVRIVEDRHQHHSIRDVEIRIAGGQAAAFEDDRARHRNLYDVEALAILVARRSQASQIVVQGRIIFVLLIRLDHRDDRVGRDEAGDVVDVAVRVVAGDALAEPDDRLDSEIVGKHLLVGSAIHGRIALLRGREQAFLGREQSAAAVDVDRAAFEHDAMFAVKRMHDARAGGLRHARAKFGIELVVVVLGPGVELEVQSEKRGAVCIDPSAAGARKMQPESRVHTRSVRQRWKTTLSESASAFSRTALALSLRTLAVDDQIDALMPRQIADDLGIDPRNRLELPRPVAVEMRPGKPGGRVRLPLGRHAVAERGGKLWTWRWLGHFPSIMRLVIGA